jgi:ribosomal protein S18 acetylase RimI-like enzyme
VTELRWMQPGDEEAVVAASALFDAPAQREWATTFLNDPRHHLLIAYEDDAPAGFVSGVEMTHPDKGAEMFLYELGVDDGYRGRGIGRALVAALGNLARSRGCYGMWVLTDADNEAAMRTYTATGAGDPDPQVMLSWDLA